MEPFALGRIQFQNIVENSPFRVDPPSMLAEATPEALAPHRHWLEPHALCPESGQLVLPVQSYLVRSSRHTILIDSCIGCDKSAAWYKPWHRRQDRGWLAALARAGVAPEAVDFVLCSHLHLDHCGWNTQLRDGRWVPTFPRARYIFARREYEHSQTQGSSTFRESVLPVMEAGQAVLVESDHALDDEVWLEPTPGHTPGHVAIHLASAGQRAVMTGDLIHSPLQCLYPDWHCLFDDDPAQACATRRRFLEDQCESGRLVMTAHFPLPSVGRIGTEGDAFRFSPLP